jgi:hypothetical protein
LLLLLLLLLWQLPVFSTVCKCHSVPVTGTVPCAVTKQLLPTVGRNLVGKPEFKAHINRYLQYTCAALTTCSNVQFRNSRLGALSVLPTQLQHAVRQQTPKLRKLESIV